MIAAPNDQDVKSAKSALVARITQILEFQLVAMNVVMTVAQLVTYSGATTIAAVTIVVEIAVVDVTSVATTIAAVAVTSVAMTIVVETAVVDVTLVAMTDVVEIDAMTTVEVAVTLVATTIAAVEIDAMTTVVEEAVIEEVKEVANVAVETPRLQLLEATVLPVVHIFNFQHQLLQVVAVKANHALRTSVRLDKYLNIKKTRDFSRVFFICSN
jgi:hypothetical protein